MAFIDYYKILGVPKDIAQDKVKAAYKKRTKQFHPDLHPNDPKAKAKFQALNEAYNVIGDPEKRKKYDQYGENWQQAEAFERGGADGFGGAGGFDGFDFSSFTGGGGFSSFFQDLFGGGHGGSRRSASGFGGFSSQPSSDVSASVTIDMYTAILGGEVIVSLSDGKKLKLKVKPGTQPGTKVRVRGKGNRRADGGYGDMILTYNVSLPVTLSDRQRSLLEQMRMG